MKSTIWFILLCVCGICSQAQPLSGTYTIGGTTPNYPTITAAANALVSNGINGPVTFNIRNGTYNETVGINTVTGSSATNTVTFQSESGDSSLVIIASTGSPFTLYNTSYFTFSKLTLRTTSTTASSGIALSDGHHFTIKNCFLTRPTGHPAPAGVSASDVDSFLTIKNCRITNLGEGIFCYKGSPPYTENVLIEHNNFSANGDAIYLSQVGSSTIRYNNCISGDGLIALNVTIDELHHNLFQAGARAAVFQSCSGTPTNWAKIYNNTFASNNTSQITNTCVALSGFDYGEFYNNSVYYNATYNYQAAFQAGNLDTVRIYNNIFMNAGAGYAYWLQTNIYGLWSDNNVIYTNGTQISSNGVTTPSQFQALYNTDYNSLFVNPQYVSPLTNLRPTNPLIDGLAVPTSWVTDDFTGTPRHPQYPDPGAYEFSVVPNVTLGADITQCGGTVTLNAVNNGSYYLWSTGQTTQSISPAVSGSYWVQVTNLAGTDRDTINVTINPLPTLSVSSNATVCAGSSTTLTATSPAASFLWSPSAGLNSTTSASVIATPLASTTYSVTATDVNNCTATQTVSVTVNPLPNVQVADAGVCPQLCTTLVASGAQTYSWLPASGLNSTTIANPLSCPATSVTYTVTGTDANGCVNTDTSRVTVYPTPVVNAGPDIYICSGDVVTLSGSGGVSCSWAPGIFLSSTTVCNPFAFPPTSLTYTLSVTDINGCSNSDLVTIYVNPLPVAFAGTDTSICAGDAVMLNGNGGVTCAWSPATALDDDSICNPTATPVNTIAYMLIVSDSNGCTNFDVVQVIVHPLPQTPVITQTGINLVSSAGYGNQWYLNGNPIPGATDTIYTPVVNGNYEVVFTDNNGCSASSGVYFFGSVGIAGSSSQEMYSITFNQQDGTIQLGGLAAGAYDFKLYNMAGSMIKEERFLSGGNQEQHFVNANGLSKGIYLVRLDASHFNGKAVVLILGD